MIEILDLILLVIMVGVSVYFGIRNPRILYRAWNVIFTFLRVAFTLKKGASKKFALLPKNKKKSSPNTRNKASNTSVEAINGK
jgi:VanZ family protein